MTTSDTSSDTSTSDSSNTTSDTTTSDTTTPPLRRWQLSVRNQDLLDPVVNGFSAHFDFNHFALINSGALASGNDLHVVFEPTPGTRIEVPRVADPRAPWGQPATRIWFQVQSEIGRGATDARYYLELRNEVVSATQRDPNQVFLAYADFDSSDAFTDEWDVVVSGSGAHTVTQSQGSLWLWMNPAAGEQGRVGIVSKASWQKPRLEVDVRAMYRMPGEALACMRALPGVMFHGAQALGGAEIGGGEVSLLYRYGGDLSRLSASGAQANSDLHDYRVTYDESLIELAQDGNLYTTALTDVSIESAPAKLSISFEMYASCGQTELVETRVDFVFVRDYLRYAPIVTVSEL